MLDCLNGYLIICDHLLSGVSTYEAFNIGPDKSSFVSVGEVADAVSEFWGGKVKWVQDLDENPHEAGLLALDAGRATESLNWRNKLEFKNAIKWTIEWHSTSLQSRDPLQTTLDQISEFMALD